MAQNPVVTFTMENGDVMKAELYPEIAPASAVRDTASKVNFHRTASRTI